MAGGFLDGGLIGGRSVGVFHAVPYRPVYAHRRAVHANLIGELFAGNQIQRSRKLSDTVQGFPGIGLQNPLGGGPCAVCRVYIWLAPTISLFRILFKYIHALFLNLRRGLRVLVKCKLIRVDNIIMIAGNRSMCAKQIGFTNVYLLVLE